MPEIVCSNLVFSYSEGVPVLDDVSCVIPQGQYAAIVGSNGSGKSTFIRHLNGLLTPEKGRVKVGGLTTAHTADIIPIRTTVGMVFQTPETQIVGTTVETDIAFALENTGVPREEIRLRIRQVLDKVGLPGFEARATAQLSSGEQQKLAIACMMALHPDIIVFDEATSMIEPEGRKEILKLISDLHKNGKTVICITHDMDEAQEAERILHFHRGKLICDLPPSEFFRRGDLESFKIGYPKIQSAARALSKTVKNMDPDTNTLAELKDMLFSQLESQTPRKRPAFGRVGIRPEVIRFSESRFSYLCGTEREQPGLDNVSLEINKGECVGILGPTGSGKSTFLQHIDALLLPQSGTVTVNGLCTGDTKTDLRKLRTGIGFAFQRPEKQLFKTYTGDDIAFGLEQFDLKLEEKAKRVYEAMNSCGLDYKTFKDRPIYALSGGEKRKAAISGVLVTSPGILLFDEPTSGLDPGSKDEIIRLIRHQQNVGVTVVFITHDLEVLCELADRVVCFDRGKIHFDGSVKAFIDSRYGGPDAPGADLLPAAARICLDPRAARLGLSSYSQSGLSEEIGEILR